MKILLLFFSLIMYQTAMCQKVYPLHPSVGDTIDLQEKLDYSLFSNLNNTTFSYAIILFQNNGFVLEVEELEEHLSTGEQTRTIVDLKLSQEEIILEQKKIQKINAYYAYLGNRERQKKKEKVSPKKSPQPLSIPSPMTENMKKEARMMIRLKEDKRRANDFQFGLRPNNNVMFELNR